MFRVECFIDDKNVVKVLYGLSGMVMNLNVTPVATVAIKNDKGGKTVSAKVGGDRLDQFKAWIRERGLPEIRAADGREFCREAGMSSGSYSSVFAAARNVGLLKRQGRSTGSKWIVNQKALEQ